MADNDDDAPHVYSSAKELPKLVSSENTNAREERDFDDWDGKDRGDEHQFETDNKGNDSDENKSDDEKAVGVGEADRPPAKTRRPGRPSGSRNRTKGAPTTADPGKDLSHMRVSAEHIEYLKKKNEPVLAAAYAASLAARQERDRAVAQAAAGREEVRALRAALEAAQRQIAEGEARLAREEASLDRALDCVFKLELQRDGYWNELYRKLVAHKERGGDVNLPARSPDPEDNELQKLCSWVAKQKALYQDYKYGGLHTTRPWRITALEDLGIQWEVKKGRWEKSYKELLAFKAAHGHCIVPTRNSKEHRDLGMWVGTQRSDLLKATKGQASPMTPARRQLLDEAGFVWNVTELKWKEMYDKLVGFRVEEGHCDVPERYPPDQPLSNFVAQQRREAQRADAAERGAAAGGRKRRARMTEKRLQLLNDIGFRW